jgi:phosphoglycerate dehydrogenase-like enzyme
MQKVMVTPTTLTGGGPFVQVLVDAGLQPIFPGYHHQLTEDEILKEVPGMSAVLAGAEPYTRRVLEAMPALRVIARAGVGYDSVDLAAATERGIAVAIAPGTNQHAVAEHTFSLLLALAKNVARHHIAVQKQTWPRQANLPLRGRTLGIAGLGRIGKEAALRGLSFHMRVIAYETFPDAAFVAKHGIELVSPEELFAQSDFLSLHMPMTPESKYWINKRTLGLMKPSAFLINTARGGLVCEKDLVEALRAGTIAGAGLDVFEKEPPDKNNPLFELDNVVLTPHTAGVDLQSRDDMALSAARAIALLSKGEWPAEQVVNPEVRSKFRW